MCRNENVANTADHQRPKIDAAAPEVPQKAGFSWIVTVYPGAVQARQVAPELKLCKALTNVPANFLGWRTVFNKRGMVGWKKMRNNNRSGVKP